MMARPALESLETSVVDLSCTTATYGLTMIISCDLHSLSKVDSTWADPAGVLFLDATGQFLYPDIEQSLDFHATFMVLSTFFFFLHLDIP
jgi:hypothetical protein